MRSTTPTMFATPTWSPSSCSISGTPPACCRSPRTSSTLTPEEMGIKPAPGPRSRNPLNLIRFRMDPLSFLHKFGEQYGDLVEFHLSGQHMFFVRHPDDIHDVLVTHNSNFVKGRALQRS